MNTPSEWELLARYLSGECSEEEQAEVETLIALDPEKQRLIASMSKVWDSPEADSGACDVSRLWGEIVDQAAITPPAPESTQDRNGRSSAAIRRYAVAAVLLVACSLVYYGSEELATPFGNPTAEWVTLAVDSGTHDEIIMSDGSRVLLDAGSILRYPEVFEDDERTVLLNGEGYFEVASDAGRPFVVHANAAVVEVLGTEFNVRAWQRE